ncbi:MAG: prenyltransferase/squalene oxidase repeat-containing protein [Gammaproteobacteria bacterium]
MKYKTLWDAARQTRDYLKLPLAAKAEQWRDLTSGLRPDPGIDRAIEESIAWLGRAQDCSITHDGGVARHYSLVTGWGPSYPETTGYIVPTLLFLAEIEEDAALEQKARRMLDWLVGIQMENGGFQGSTVNTRPLVAVTFNTGQILLGLAAGAARFGEPYRATMDKAAHWLATTQDSDGCWRKHQSPFVTAGDKAYDTHVAWGLVEAARVANHPAYGDAAMRNVIWSLTKQQANGWFADCCLNDPSQPLTHTIGYVLRGILEVYRYSREPALLEAALKTARGLLGVIRDDGFVAGRLYPNWGAAVRWACLTGSVQIASCWMLLYQETGDPGFRDAAFLANQYVRRTLRLNGPPETRGAVKGAFPVSGHYGPYQYLNWAAKFSIDANLLEHAIRGADKAL